MSRLLTNNQTIGWKILSVRIPPSDMQALERKHPNKGDKAIIIRALIQMYLEGKIQNVQHVSRF